MILSLQQLSQRTATNSFIHRLLNSERVVAASLSSTVGGTRSSHGVNESQQLTKLPIFVTTTIDAPSHWSTRLKDNYFLSKRLLENNAKMLQNPFIFGNYDDALYQMMNRNARKPKKANHGKRPCSRYKRRKKSRKYGNPNRGW